MFNLLINKEKSIIIFLMLCSSLFGFRIVNEYLKFDDRSKYESESYSRALTNGSEIQIFHSNKFNIKANGSNTTVFVSDSFGEGAKCGNAGNISGCLSKLEPKKNIINLSLSGKGPAFYLKQIKNYFYLQKEENQNYLGSSVIVSIYSNDIVLDPQLCKFYDSNKSKLFNKLDSYQIAQLSKRCDHLLSLTPSEYKKEMKYVLPFSKAIQSILGNYSYLYLREMIAQISFKVFNNISIGRAGYIPLWKDNDSVEVILIAEVLKEMVRTCQKYNCNLTIATFPNVENLYPNSKVRLSLLEFANFMQTEYSIKIHDGYEPFINRGIRKATYSLTDIHSNCEGYNIYANWLVDL
tara:strand:- start:522 stop:1574 length:1053 start_codon:yes stop_codon:yes gene_type:complete